MPAKNYFVLTLNDRTSKYFLSKKLLLDSAAQTIKNICVKLYYKRVQFLRSIDNIT